LFAWLLKPRPYPAFALLAIIIGIFGFALPRKVGIVFFAIGAILLFTFIRSLMIDLSIGREGVTAFGRVTSIEHTGEPWTVHFTFTDASGAVHQQTFDIWDAKEASQYAEGSSVKIRYHPRYPDDVWRWLE